LLLRFTIPDSRGLLTTGGTKRCDREVNLNLFVGLKTPHSSLLTPLLLFVILRSEAIEGSDPKTFSPQRVGPRRQGARKKTKCPNEEKGRRVENHSL